MKRKLFSAVVFGCLIILIVQFGKQLFPDIFGVTPKGGLKIMAFPEAAVYLNGLEVGKTPFSEENLNVGEYSVQLISPESSWQGKITLNKGALSVINRSLASTEATSSGDSLVLDQGQGVIITSSPTGSSIEIDGKLMGVTPLSVSDLSPGAHSFNISHNNYSARKVEVVLPANLSLHIDVDLALIIKGEGIVETPTIAKVQKLVVKQTPLGYLRLREKPSLNSKEVAQVSSGEVLDIISEAPGWIQVRLKNNLEGYISSQYIKKLP